MLFCFRGTLQIWIILIGFPDANNFVNVSICKGEFKFHLPRLLQIYLKLMYDDRENTETDHGHTEVFNLY